MVYGSSHSGAVQRCESVLEIRIHTLIASSFPCSQPVTAANRKLLSAPADLAYLTDGIRQFQSLHVHELCQNLFQAYNIRKIPC